MEILKINKSNYPAIAKIYEQGIASGIATFETKSKSWEQWDKSHCSFARIAVKDEQNILGWAALSPVSDRCAYEGVAEISIYVSSKSQGIGIGKKLMDELIIKSEQNKIWTLQSGIFKENIASQKLHLSCGFRQIGYRERIGQVNGKWHDNILFERRSALIGC